MIFRILSLLLWAAAVGLSIFGGLLFVAHIIVNWDWFLAALTLAATTVVGVTLTHGALKVWDLA